MRGATDPITSLDSGRPASAPGATTRHPPASRLRSRYSSPPTTALQARVFAEHVPHPKGPAPGGVCDLQATTAGTEGNRDSVNNNNMEGEASVGGYRSLIAKKLGDVEEDYDEFVLRAPSVDKCESPAALAAQEEGDNGEDTKMDDDDIFLVAKLEIPT